MGQCQIVCGVISVCFGVALAITIGIVASSFKRLESHEVGIQYNTYTKQLGQKVYSEGLHVGSPSFVFIKFPSVFTSMEFSGVKCLNKDGVFVALSISFQYRARGSGLTRILRNFEDEDTYGSVLNYVGRAAIFDACSQYNTTQFQAERGSFQGTLTRRLVERFNNLWADVTDLQVRDVQRPRGYENTIRSKETAREEIEVARNERPRQVTTAQTGLREAETEANIIVSRALSEARIYTTRAESEAAAILNDYKQEAATYSSLKDSNGLDTVGFLAYMGVRTIADAKNPVHVGLKGPAQTSFVPTN